jgi:hypothetical protein
MNTARPLVIAAVQLLQQRATSAAPQSAVLFLIRGALRALEPDFAEDRTNDADAVSELRQAMDLLTGSP